VGFAQHLLSALSLEFLRSFATILCTVLCSSGSIWLINCIVNTVNFADVSKVKNKTLEVLNNISTEEFQKCFQQWEKCWYKCIESKTEYFEGD